MYITNSKFEKDVKHQNGYKHQTSNRPIEEGIQFPSETCFLY